MSGAATQLHPILLVVNYWEIRSARIGATLDVLLQEGVSEVATFVPWQHFESDISHALLKFIQAAAERKMTVSLLLSPELGVHYASSGLPKDLAQNREVLAADSQGNPFTAGLPPNLFRLPSLHSEEFQKRYHAFLTRVNGFLSDLDRAGESLLGHVRVVLTGSYWKQYRTARASADSAFGGEAGDRSRSADLAFRRHVEEFYSQREFSEKDAGEAKRWKTRSYDPVNRKYFNQVSEDVFRARSAQIVGRRALGVPIVEAELFAPEADPGNLYSFCLQTLAGGHADFSRYASVLREVSRRSSAAGGRVAVPLAHWTSFGGFRTLAEPEQQYLILSSLILMGGRGGGVLIEADEWLAFSRKFRSRADGLARSLAEGRLRLRNRALYLAPHLWSRGGTLWEEISGLCGDEARMVASLDLVLRDPDALVAFVDPAMILTKELVSRLISWAAGGRVVAIPRSMLYSGPAKAEVEKLLASVPVLQVHLGVPYRLAESGEGKVVLYDPAEGAAAGGEAVGAWATFARSILGLAEIRPACRVSDGRVGALPLARDGGGARGTALFVHNTAGRTVTADLIFDESVVVWDLASAMADVPAAGTRRPAPGTRFTLEVPPCGILPVAVDGMTGELDERHVARASSGRLREAAADAAIGALPGLPAGGGGDTAWN